MQSAPDNGLRRNRGTDERNVTSVQVRCGVMNEHVGAAMGKFSSLLLLRGVFVEHRLLDAPLCEEFPESHHLVLSA